MDEKKLMPGLGQSLPGDNGKSSDKAAEVIPIIHEHAVVHREIVETGKVHIRKKVTEEVISVNLPVINESYRVEHVPVEKKILDTPPPALRYEGDKMIIPVLREITVVQKKYEVIEELHITRQSVETPLVQEITLLKEHIHVERNSTKLAEE
jgi:stress response protein YsnF